MNDDEILYTMALTRTLPMNYVNQNVLLDAVGSASVVYENRNDIRAVLPSATENLQGALYGMDSVLERCKRELDFARRGHILCLTKNDPLYPNRLRLCPDAPILLYYCGNADLNAKHVINMVGTRHCTEYGKDICRHFIEDLSQMVPDLVVVSGLAYGIDVNAHRVALQNKVPTVGVLAHGLDQIYPRTHRDTAIQMVANGGLLTEYMSQSHIDKKNFVARNRIVAGMCEATIVVESASHGGSLITAGIANSYGREVFAFPGRISDQYSEGCNKLISRSEAVCITSAEQFAETMNWDVESDAQRKGGIQRQLFIEFSADEQCVVDALRGSDGKQVNTLVTDTGMAIGRLTSLLFELEMKGVVKAMCGSTYRLLD